MKKFILKQWYPSLSRRVEKGDIATFDGSHYRIVKEFQQYEDCGLTEGWYHFEKEEVENNPDFWELIEEKKPLFITDDGVEVFNKNHVLWEVLQDFQLVVTTAGFVEKWNKTFAHESNANEYILLNKPIFSYEDFIKWGNIPYPRAIEDLAKKRIEQ